MKKTIFSTEYPLRQMAILRFDSGHAGKWQMNHKGFTLIELLVATTIAVILMSIGIVSFTNAGKTARDVKRRSDLEAVRQAMTLYRADVGEFPTGSYDSIAAELVAEEYLVDPYPEDPLTNLVVPPNAWYAGLRDTFDITAHAAADYPYTYVGDEEVFCICARMENGNGNSLTGPGSLVNLCQGIGDGDLYYCVKNL